MLIQQFTKVTFIQNNIVFTYNRNVYQNHSTIASLSMEWDSSCRWNSDHQLHTKFCLGIKGVQGCGVVGLISELKSGYT